MKPSDSNDVTISEPIDAEHLRYYDFVDASDFHLVYEQCIWLVLVSVWYRNNCSFIHYLIWLSQVKLEAIQRRSKLVNLLT